MLINSFEAFRAFEAALFRSYPNYAEDKRREGFNLWMPSSKKAYIDAKSTKVSCLPIPNHKEVKH